MPRHDKRIRIFSALEVSNICGVVNQTAINWIKSGYLKAFTTPGGQYRVYADDLLEFLRSRGMRVPKELLQLEAEEGEWNRVLIVDDDSEFNNVVKKYLGKRLPDHTILQALDGYEAGRFLAEHKPSVIILDIDLPGIDGHNLCKKIKGDTGLGNPVIIAVTGLKDPKEKESILKDGADAFFSKPVDLAKLFQTIQMLVGENRG
jgi:CheY-like chemotaxis protein